MAFLLTSSPMHQNGDYSKFFSASTSTLYLKAKNQLSSKIIVIDWLPFFCVLPWEAHDPKKCLDKHIYNIYT